MGRVRPATVSLNMPAGISPAYTLTKYTYTGQFSYMDDPTTSGVTEGFGLMYYGARMYDPALGRFTSADTIIPSTQGVQGWDRYAYVNNNPIRYNDPTGHMCREDGYGCDGSSLQKTKIDDENGPRMVDGNSKKESKDYAKRWKEEKTLKDLIMKEIDRRFDPFTGWLPAGFNYEASGFPTEDYYAEQAYMQAGYDIMQIASQNQNNPMTEQDWLNSDADIDYIYSKGVRGQAPGHQFFLNYMGRDINNPSNYEANYLNALMVTHKKELGKAKGAYYDQLLSQHGSLQASWDFLQMNIGVNGPD